VVELTTKNEEEQIRKLGEAEYTKQLERKAECGGVPDIIGATDSLGRLGASDVLTHLCTSENEFTRECAVEALGNFGDATALPTLHIVAETDKSQPVRNKADKAIGQISLVLRQTADLLQKDGKKGAAEIQAAASLSRQQTRQQAQPRVCIRIGGL